MLLCKYPFQEVPVNYFTDCFTEWNSVPTPSPDRPQPFQEVPVNYFTDYFTEWNSVPTHSPDRSQGMPVNYFTDSFTEWNSVPTPSPDRPQEVPVNYFTDCFTKWNSVPTPSPDRPQESRAMDPSITQKSPEPEPVTETSIWIEPTWLQHHHHLDAHQASFNNTTGARPPPPPPPTAAPPPPPLVVEAAAPPPPPAGAPPELEVRLIYKVPHHLRAVKEKAYEPNVISIGPYHYGKAHLKAMQVIKWSCFSKIAEETRFGFGEFLNAMMPFEERVRSCYEEPCCLESREYVEMMIHDGCFIVGLIRRIYPEDDIFTVARIQADIWNDLLLLENQLPFFVLVELDRMITPNGGDLNRYASLFKTMVRLPGPEVQPKKDIKHLLDLVHDSYRPSPQGIEEHDDFKAKTKNSKPQRSWKFIRSATELEEAGIKFGEKVKDHDQDQEGLVSLFDIELTKGTKVLGTKVLKIPTLRVDDNTERILRNYMAYEQFFPRKKPTYFVDYVVFMDNLINTGKDVQLLCNSGVIDNWLGDDEAVAEMFNKLRDSIYMSEDFYYTEIFGRVNEHCQRKWNKWRATMKKNYFNSPWSLISFLAAVALLLLTLLQAIFAVLSY